MTLEVRNVDESKCEIKTSFYRKHLASMKISLKHPNSPNTE